MTQRLIISWTLVLLVAFALAGDVVVLTDESYDETLKKSPVVMVKFFAPWCGHCKSFAPEYEKAATMLKEQKKDYVLAELDATVHKKAAEKNGIQGFPTIKLFLNGKAIDYNGDRTAEAVISFIDKRTSPPSTELKNAAAVKEKKESKGLRCILATDDTKVVAEYLDVAKSVEEFTYFHASVAVVKEIFSEVQAGNVVLLKDFDEGKAIYTGAIKDLATFLHENMIPTVTEVNQKVIEMVFQGSGRKGIFLFRSVDDANAKVMEAEFHKVATSLKSKDYVFVQTDVREGWGQRVANYFGIEAGSLPILEIVDVKEEIHRYRHTGVIRENEIKQFVEAWKKGTVARYMKSEPVPKENPGPIFKTVGKTFQHDVIDNDDDVIVKFYAPWCGHCKKLEPIFKSLAEALSGNKKLKFYEVDATKNDIAGHPIQGFPVVKLFPGKDKANVYTHEGERTEADIAKFIKDKASHPVEMPEFKPKEDSEKSKDDL